MISVISKTFLPISFFFIIFALGCQGNTVFSNANENQPDIQFEERVYDFGIAGQEKTIACEFRFVNVGQETLVIESVKTSCGCLAILIPSKEIPVDADGVIKVSFETGKFKNRQTKNIYVHSNDPDEPEIELEVTGMVKTGIVLDPEFLSFGDTQKGNAITRTFKIINLGEEPLVLNRVEVAKDYFTSKFDSLRDERYMGYKVDVVLRLDAPEGRFTEVITLHTNSHKHPRIDIPVIGNVIRK